jgi:hypothetical protein
MIRQIEVEEGEARRTAALMGLVVILRLAIPGVMVMRGLEQSFQIPDQSRTNVCETNKPAWVRARLLAECSRP